MTADISALLATLLLAFVLTLAPGLYNILRLGGVRMAGNRDNLPPLEGWGARSQRALSNLYESLPIFIALVLIAHIMERSNEATALGAQLFLWGRIGHAVLYIAGVPWLRSLAYILAVVGMVMIAGELL